MMAEKRYRIYPTEVGKCALAYWFEYNGFTKSPTHVKSYIGSITHKYVEDLITYGEIKDKRVKKVEQDREEGNAHLDHVLDHGYAGAEHYIPKIEQWIANTSLLDDKDNNFILDFKTGSNRLFKATKIQMGSSLWLMNNSITPLKMGLNSEAGIKGNLNKDYILSGRIDLYNKVNESEDYKVYVVYFGDTEDKLVREFTPREIKECKALFKYELPATIASRERIHTTNLRPICPSWCPIPQFCSYRSHCVGV